MSKSAQPSCDGGEFRFKLIVANIGLECIVMLNRGSFRFASNIRNIWEEELMQ